MYPSWPGSRAAAVGLIVTNAVPLVGVVGFGWDRHSLRVVYWLESGVVGAETVAKIIRAEGGDNPEALPSIQFDGRPIDSFLGQANWAIATLFVFHYGLFWVVHGVFVLVFPIIVPGPDPASPAVVAVAAVGLAGYHVVSPCADYVAGREYERSGPVTLMVEPYRRVFVLHLTIVLGGFAIAPFGAPVGVLAVMVLVKTALDNPGPLEGARARTAAPFPGNHDGADPDRNGRFAPARPGVPMSSDATTRFLSTLRHVDVVWRRPSDRTNHSAPYRILLGRDTNRRPAGGETVESWGRSPR